MTATTAPTRNTYKGHGKPETFVYFGRWTDAPTETGTLATVGKDEWGRLQVRNAETGAVIQETLRPAQRIWIAPC